MKLRAKGGPQEGGGGREVQSSPPSRSIAKPAGPDDSPGRGGEAAPARPPGFGFRLPGTLCLGLPAPTFHSELGGGSGLRGRGRQKHGGGWPPACSGSRAAGIFSPSPRARPARPRRRPGPGAPGCRSRRHRMSHPPPGETWATRCARGWPSQASPPAWSGAGQPRSWSTRYGTTVRKAELAPTYFLVSCSCRMRGGKGEGVTRHALHRGRRCGAGWFIISPSPAPRPTGGRI